MQYEIRNIRDFTKAQYEDMYRTAAPERRERTDRFRFADDRARCLCADHLARHMLAKTAGITPAEISFSLGHKDKPQANIPLHFNLSHSGEYVLCAVAKTPIGVDIEQIKPFRAGMVNRFFNGVEAAYVWGDSPAPEGNVTAPEICRRFYRVWTAKEAYTKMTGTGISTDLKAIGFDPQTMTVCGVPLTCPKMPDGYVASIVKAPV